MSKKIHLNKNSFFYNTLIILITGFIIKALGLINRIFITRILGPSGMTLYIMAFPTIMLFINISCMSLNIVISKLVSESIKTKRYSPKILLKKSITISLVVSLITIVCYLAFLYPLTHFLLKNDNLFFPLLSTVFLIPLVGISDSLKGYFNGLKQMKYSSSASLAEQIARIIFSIVILYITIPYGIKIATFFCLLALSIGELVSILYSLKTIKKIKQIDYPNTSGEAKAILKMSIPTTLSHLVGNFTYFLEPIVFVWILTLLSYSQNLVEEVYTTINAFTLSLLTLGSFVSNALATTVVPSVSESFASKQTDKVNHYTKKTIIYSLIPGLIITIVLFFYPSEVMNLIYNTSKGSTDIKKYVFFFIPYYLQLPLSAIYQALGQAKSLFKISSFFNILRIILIIILSLIPSINYQSLMLATTITLILNCLVIYLKIKKLTSFSVSFRQSINLLIIFIFCFVLTLLFKTIELNFIVSIIIVFIVYFLLCYKFKLISISSIISKFS